MGRVDQSDGAHDAATPARLDFPFLPAGQVVPPDSHFPSDDISVIAPVLPDPAHPERPLIADGHTRLDQQGTYGLFCSFKPGTTTVRLSAGTVQAQLPVTVHAGTGTQCGPLAPIPPPPPKPVPVKIAPVLPVQAHPVPPGVAPVPAAPHSHVRPHVPSQVVGAVVPPPAEVVPAPPGGGGVGESAGEREKEEESEAATENANMTALHRHRALDDWLPLGGAGLGTGLAAYCFARGRRRRAGAGRAAVATLGSARWRDRE